VFVIWPCSGNMAGGALGRASDLLERDEI